MPRFRVTHNWSSRNRTSLQPQFKDFQKVDKLYNLEFHDAGKTFEMTNLSTGEKVLTGQKSEFAIQTICKHWGNVSFQYQTSGFAGGAFNIFKDGTAELVTYGSGLPIIDVSYGTLL